MESIERMAAEIQAPEKTVSEKLTEVIGALTDIANNLVAVAAEEPAADPEPVEPEEPTEDPKED